MRGSGSGFIKLLAFKLMVVEALKKNIKNYNDWLTYSHAAKCATL